ncbi:MAG: DUF58 domain-containing protein [Myxococcota bacterium]
MAVAAPSERAAPLTPREVRRLGRAIPRRLRFTREGKLLFFVTLGVGFGAVNSGNNLLYLVLGILLSLIMISGVLSELTLRGVRAVRFDPPHLFAGQPALVRVDLHNAKRRLVSYSVELAELVGPSWGLEQRRAFVLRLAPGETLPAHLRVEASTRGWIPTAGLRLTTRFPFGFFEKSRFVPIPARYLVFPRIRPVAPPSLRPIVAGAEEEIARIGQGDEFYALRDARIGDDARSIAWKVTARRDKLVVRESQRPAARRVMLTLANVIPRDVPAARRRLERAIEHVANLATALVEEGYAVGLATADGGVAPDGGHVVLVRIYEILAGLPVRTVRAGTRVPLFDEYTRRNVERLAVVTLDQRRAGIPVDADRHLPVPGGEEPEAEEAA